MSRKHLVFVNQHYYPDHAATALALTDLAEWLRNHGYQVSVVCSQHAYDGSEEFPNYENVNGVDIHRVRNSTFGRSSHAGRFIDYLTFFMLAFMRLLRMKFDVLITLTTPPLLGVLHSLLKPLKECKSVNWFMDLHPEAELAHNMLDPQSTVTRLLRLFHRSFTANLDLAVVLSSGMRTKLIKQEPRANPVIHRIWTDEREVYPMDKQEAKHAMIPDLTDKFIVHYSGNMGIAHDFITMLDAARALRDDDRFHFIFSGGGPQKGIITSYLTRHKLNNVSLMPYVKRSELAQSMAKADLHWVSLRPSFEGVAFPSKTYGYMASGRPVVFIGSLDSDTGYDIEAAQCGRSFKMGDTPGVVNYIQKLADNNDTLDQLGENGYQFFRDHAARDVVCHQWQRSIQSL